eukprot:CAMPEP_0198116306 /NCGR_PEP_ID=MMETSP1442-20131203/11285_1 /TAXON_ID= /ORGANISM="Craspedostauros australis, Strain CCMP3328" /LENGTH=197 /DNA_ID=CAMNT_0043774091 /DNA_START=60 /DNA_END=653 /DNA_ORIENTATION=+
MTDSSTHGPMRTWKCLCMSIAISVLVASSNGSGSPLGGVAAAASWDDPENDIYKQQALAKPWFTSSLVIGGTNFYISPISIVSFFFVVINCYYIIFRSGGSGAFARANHILVAEEEAAKRLKSKVGNDFARFQEHAAKYSSCPSKNNGGDLGKFKPGDMAPPFDKTIFNPENPIHVTLGPIQTQFGWHLIFIQDRKL